MDDKARVAERLTQLPADKRELLRKLLAGKAAIKPIPRREPMDAVPLSFSQQRLWLVEQLLEGETAYSQTNFIRLPFQVDCEAFARALNSVVARHEILRATFHSVDGEPFQRFRPSLDLAMPVTDLRHAAPEARESEALALVARDFEVPFDLETGPLIRAAMYRLDDREYLFALTLHHMVCDGWSMGVLAVELSAQYYGYVLGREVPLPELPVQYGDFAVWQRRSLGENQLNPQLAYWRAQLAGIRTLDFPADHPRPAQFTYRGARVPVLLSGELFRRLESLAGQHGTTMHVLLLAALFALAHRYTGEDDIAIGAPVAGRTRKELEALIGFFVNTQVIRMDLSGDPPFADLLARARQACVAAFANQDVPFERLVEELHPARDASRNPLVQVVFQLFQPPAAPGLDQSAIFPFTPAPAGGSKFDLVFELIHRPGEVRGFAEFNTDLFEEERIRRLVAHLENLLQSAVDDPERPISRLEILSPEERQRVLQEWNATALEYARDSNLVAEFQAQVRRTPERTAAAFGAASLSYAVLERRVAAVASALAAVGVGPGDCVGLLMERCLELAPAMLGILAAGAFYVPLDPRYPTARLAYLLADSGAKAVVSTAALRDVVSECGLPVVLAEQAGEASSLAPPPVAPEQTAWLLYTSGTTGQPKGVPVTHRGALRLIRGIDTPASEADSVLQFAPITFDASVFEIWMALLNGARLVMHPPDTPSLDELGTFIQDQRLTWVFLTTSLFRQMIEQGPRCFRGVRQVVTGGEALPAAVARTAWRELPRTRITNAYGPTECATIVTTYTIDNLGAIHETVPIGKPIGATAIYLLDRYGNPVPPGIPGEIHIGGDGVGPGYWKRPELTARSFVPDPWSAVPGATLYRTGDMGRYRADGNIEFLGRRDRQVKVSGYRIELGEVEAAIAAHPDVAAAAALALDQEECGRLAAFAERMPGHSVSAAELRDHLAALLPRYMVPAHVEVIDRLPLTASGKVDLAALAQRASSGAECSEGFVEPESPLEQVLARIWKDLLHVERVGATDDFFELGGQSLVATRLLSRVRDALQAAPTMREFFEDPTVRGLAVRLSREEGAVRRAGLLLKLDALAARRMPPAAAGE